MTRLSTRARRSRAGRDGLTAFRIGPGIALDAVAGRVLIRRIHGAHDELVRVYDSSLAWRPSCAGGGWMLSCDESIDERDGEVVWTSGDGLMRPLRPGDAGRWIASGERDGVCWRERGAWIVETGDRRLRLERSRAAGAYLLAGGVSEGAALQVVRDPSDRATGFRAPTGALHRLEHDADGRLSRMWVEGNVRGSWLALEHDGDRLARVRDASGRPREEYEHDGMLLVAARFDGAAGVFFEYDGRDEHARCTRAWTEDGEIDLALHHSGDRTLIEEQGRGAWAVQCDAHRRPTSIVDPSSATVALTWAGDRVTRATSASIEWSSDSPTEALASCGGAVAARRRRGDELVESACIDGREVILRTSAGGRPTSVMLDGRRIAAFEWRSGQLVGAIVGDRSIAFEHDAAGRWIAATGPTAFVARRDDTGRIAELTWAEHRLARKETPCGPTWRLLRDERERVRVTRPGPNRVELVIDERSLTITKNRRGERLGIAADGVREIELVRDGRGLLVALVDAEHRLEIERDRAGRARVLRGAGVATRIGRDGSGRMARAHRPDGSSVDLPDERAQRLRHVIERADRAAGTTADLLESLGVLVSVVLVGSASDVVERLHPQPDDWVLLPEALLPWRGVERVTASAPIHEVFEALVLGRPTRPASRSAMGTACPRWLSWLSAWMRTSEAVGPAAAPGGRL